MTNQVKIIRIERIWLKPNINLGKLCHLSKNLYNEANYIVRQAFFKNEKINLNKLQIKLNNSTNFLALPSSSALKILKIVEKAWKSFFTALADWKTHPKKYFQKPKIPKYKEKKGQFLLPFSKHQINFINGIIKLPHNVNVQVKTRLPTNTILLGVRIIPKGVGYVLEILYVKKVPAVLKNKPDRVVGIDIGLTNLITMVNNIGEKPIVVKGGVPKSVNQFYNKEQARLQGIYDKLHIKRGKKLLKLIDKRNRKISYFFHEASRFVIQWCQKNEIDTVIIGRNKNWKQYDRIAAMITRKIRSPIISRYNWQAKKTAKIIDFKKLALNIKKVANTNVWNLYQYIYNSKELRLLNESLNHGHTTLRNHLLVIANLIVQDLISEVNEEDSTNKRLIAVSRTNEGRRARSLK